MVIPTNDIYMENSFEAGYQFSPGRTLSYAHYFENTLINVDPEKTGFSVVNNEGFIRTRVNNLWENKGLGLSFNYQNRAYLPVSRTLGERGMVVTLRNYLTLVKKLGDSVKLSLSEMPIIPINSKAGHAGAANPAFQNRIYLIGDISVTDKLSVSLPVFFWFTKYRDFAPEAANNDATTFTLMIYPEVSYSLTDNVSVGIAYYSDNMVQSDLSGLNLGEGLKAGVTQLVLAASL